MPAKPTKTSKHEAEHLTALDLVRIIHDPEMEWRRPFIGHLVDGCSECWQTLRAGVTVRLLNAAEEWPHPKPPHPITGALARLAAFHAPETPGVSKADLLRSLLPRHRQALRMAQDQSLGFLHLVLEESWSSGFEKISCPVGGTTPWLHVMPLEQVRKAVQLVSRYSRRIAESYDLQAQGHVLLTRANHVQGAPAERLHDHIRKAATLARQGTGDLLLQVTLHEIRSLPEDVSFEERIAHLDNALGLLEEDDSSNAWNELRAELLLRKGRLFPWQPEQELSCCVAALKLLDHTAGPRLRLAALDQMAAVQYELGDHTAARDAWLEAQRISDTAQEEPALYCRRWVNLARIPLTQDMVRDRETAYRAAASGYRALNYRDEAAQVLVELALFLLDEDALDRFQGLEAELDKALHPQSVQRRDLIEVARAKGLAAAVLSCPQRNR